VLVRSTGGCTWARSRCLGTNRIHFQGGGGGAKKRKWDVGVDETLIIDKRRMGNDLGQQQAKRLSRTFTPPTSCDKETQLKKSRCGMSWMKTKRDLDCLETEEVQSRYSEATMRETMRGRYKIRAYKKHPRGGRGQHQSSRPGRGGKSGRKGKRG